MKKYDVTNEVKPAHGLTVGGGRPALMTVTPPKSQPLTETWLTAPGTNALSFGCIPVIEDRYDQERCCTAGEIRMPLGNIAKGFVHLNAAKRKERFGQLGPIGFVHAVTSNYDEIWVQQGRGALLLLRCDGNKAVILSRNLVESAYVVVRAFPLGRSHNFKRLKEVRVWPRLGW